MKSTRTFAAKVAAGVVGLVIVAGACSTGVSDIEGWRKAVGRDYPCAELEAIALKLPDDVDRNEVERDLTRLGCDLRAAR